MSTARRNPGRFTEEEDSIIIRFVQQYPDNIQEGLRKAQEEITVRSFGVIKNRYYAKIRTNPNILAVTCGSNKGFTRNVKNTQRFEGQFPEDRTLNKIEWLMKQLLDIDVESRETILSFFKKASKK